MTLYTHRNWGGVWTIIEDEDKISFTATIIEEPEPDQNADLWQILRETGTWKDTQSLDYNEHRGYWNEIN